MSENAKEALERIAKKVSDLPENVAREALDQLANRMEGFADGFKAREAMNKFKMEAASEVGVNLKEGYNGDLTSKQAGSIGGEMVRKMIKKYEENL